MDLDGGVDALEAHAPVLARADLRRQDLVALYNLSKEQVAYARAKAERRGVSLGLGRIAALYYRSPTSLGSRRGSPVFLKRQCDPSLLRRRLPWRGVRRRAGGR